MSGMSPTPFPILHIAFSPPTGVSTMSDRARAQFHDAIEHFGKLLDAIPAAKRVLMYEDMSQVEIKLRLGAIGTQLLWRALPLLCKDSKDAFDLAGDIRGFFAAFGHTTEEL
jgi:hypothetical protein